MLDGTPKLDSSSEVAAARPTSGSPAGDGGARMRIPPDTGGLPSSPPPEVRAAVEEVARGLDELAQRRLSLRFALGSDAHVRIQLQHAGGRVVREIPASVALDLLENDPAELADEV